MEELDALFHQVQQEVATWTVQPDRQIGSGNAQVKLVAVETTLHHLMTDVGVRSHFATADASGVNETPPVPPDAPSSATPVAPADESSPPIEY
jgi:hypothetical protein